MAISNNKKIGIKILNILLIIFIPIMLTYLISQFNLDQIKFFRILLFNERIMIYYVSASIVSILVILWSKYKHTDLDLFLPNELGDGEFTLTFTKSAFFIFLAHHAGTSIYYNILKKLFFYVPLQGTFDGDLFSEASFLIKVLAVLFSVIFYGILPGVSFALIKSGIDKLFKSKIPFFNLGTLVCVSLFVLVHVLFAEKDPNIYVERIRYISRIVFMSTIMLISDTSKNTWASVALFTFWWHSC